MVFACYLLSKEANMHINLICFDRNFDHPYINLEYSVLHGLHGYKCVRVRFPVSKGG